MQTAEHRLGMLDSFIGLQGLIVKMRHLDATPPTVFAPELQGTEPSNVFRVVEHPANDGLLLLHLHGEPGQDDLLEHDAIRLAAQQ